MNAIEREVLRYIGEDPDSPDVFLDTDQGMEPIRDSINDCQEEIAILTGSHTVSYPIALVQDQMFYRLRFEHGAFGWVTSAWLVNQKTSLEQTDLIQLASWNPRWLKTDGEPDAYFPVGPQIIGFYPRPSGTSDVVDLTCVVVPRRYTRDSDPVLILDAFQRACVHYAVSEYWASRGDATEALIEHQRYIQILGVRNIVPAAAEDIVQLKTQKQGQTLRTKDAV